MAEWRAELRSPATQWGAFTTPLSFLCKLAKAGLMDNTPNPVAPKIPHRAKTVPRVSGWIAKMEQKWGTSHTSPAERQHTVRAGVSHHRLRDKKLKFVCKGNCTDSSWKPLPNSPVIQPRTWQIRPPTPGQALGTTYLGIGSGGIYFT